MIAVLGAGQMGEALISGLLRAGVVAPGGIIAAARRSGRAQQLRDAYGIEVLTAAAAAQQGQTLVIAVKPQDMGALLEEIRPAVTPAKLVISILSVMPVSVSASRTIGWRTSSRRSTFSSCEYFTMKPLWNIWWMVM